MLLRYTRPLSNIYGNCYNTYSALCASTTSSCRPQAPGRKSELCGFKVKALTGDHAPDDAEV